MSLQPCLLLNPDTGRRPLHFTQDLFEFTMHANLDRWPLAALIHHFCVDHDGVGAETVCAYVDGPPSLLTTIFER